MVDLGSDGTYIAGEKALLVAMFERAIKDALDSRYRVSEFDREQAIKFLMDDPFCDDLCGFLEVDPTSMREGLMAKLEEIDQKKAEMLAWKRKQRN